MLVDRAAGGRVHADLLGLAGHPFLGVLNSAFPREMSVLVGLQM